VVNWFDVGLTLFVANPEKSEFKNGEGIVRENAKSHAT